MTDVTAITNPVALGVTASVTATPVVGKFVSNTPVPLPLPDAPNPVVASDVTAATPEGTAVHDVVFVQEPHPILRHFEFGHLPLHLAAVSQEFHRLAHVMHHTLPDGPEKSAGLRKLLEAKDAFVRAAVEGESDQRF